MKWFKRWGWIHRPVSVEGWLLTLGIGALMAMAFVAIDRGSHSVSDTLAGVFPHVVSYAVVWEWVAGKTEG